MTLPRWPGGRTSVENRIEDGGRKCSGSWSEWFGAEGLLSSTWTARQACHGGQIDGGATASSTWQDGETTVLFDPVLTARLGHLRRVRRPVPPSHAAHADIILISHLHADQQLVAALSRLRPGHVSGGSTHSAWRRLLWAGAGWRVRVDRGWLGQSLSILVPAIA